MGRITESSSVSRPKGLAYRETIGGLFIKRKETVASLQSLSLDSGRVLPTTSVRVTHGGCRDGRARKVHFRRDRGHRSCGRLAQGQSQRTESELSASDVSGVWAECVSSAHRRSSASRSGRLGFRPASGHSDHLLPTPLPWMRRLLQRRHGGSGSAEEPLYTPGDSHSGSAGGGRWPAVPIGLVAFVAGPSGFRPLRHRSELGRSGGEKGPPNTSPARILTRPWRTSPATSPRTNCKTVPSVFFRSWTTARSSGSSTKCWTTIQPTRTSDGSSGVSKPRSTSGG